MKKVKDNSSVPRNGWTYVDPDDGQVIKSPYFNVLMGRAKDYRRANNFPVGAQFNEQFEQILCEHNPDACIDFVPPTEMDRASNFVKALAKWAKAGFPVRSKEESEAVLAICRDCNFYDGENGILKVVCKLCRCSRKKVAFRTEKCPQGKW